MGTVTDGEDGHGQARGDKSRGRETGGGQRRTRDNNEIESKRGERKLEQCEAARRTTYSRAGKVRESRWNCNGGRRLETDGQRRDEPTSGGRGGSNQRRRRAGGRKEETRSGGGEVAALVSAADSESVGAIVLALGCCWCTSMSAPRSWHGRHSSACGDERTAGESVAAAPAERSTARSESASAGAANSASAALPRGTAQRLHAKHSGWYSEPRRTSGSDSIHRSHLEKQRRPAETQGQSRASAPGQTSCNDRARSELSLQPAELSCSCSSVALLTWRRRRPMTAPRIDDQRTEVFEWWKLRQRRRRSCWRRETPAQTDSCSHSRCRCWCATIRRRC